jgi:hypothetical protein
MKSRILHSWLARLIAIGVIALLAAACSPQDVKAYYQSIGHPITDSQAADQANAVNSYLDQQANLHRFDYALSDASLARLRACESGGNYGAVSASGTYRGAYQFSRQTWNGVAAAFFPTFGGLDPAAAAPDVQDAFTRALYTQRGRAPWPVCGARL